MKLSNTIAIYPNFKSKEEATERRNTVITSIDATSLKEKELQLEKALKEAKLAREQAEAAKDQVAQTENLLRDALEAVSDAFMLWDKNDKLIMINNKIFEIHPNSQDIYVLGRTFEEIMRTGLEKGDFEVPEGMTKQQRLEQRVATHKTGNYQNVRKVKGRWLQVREQRTSQGNIVTTAINVEQLKEREHQLEIALKEAKLARKQAEAAHKKTTKALKDAEIARAQAEKATQAKSQFLNMMSHEIRTPLQGVINMSHLLMASIIDSDQHDKLMTILRSSEALLTTLNDALDIAKVEAGKLSIKITSFDLKKLVEGVMVMYTLPVQAKNLSFSYSIDPNLPRFLKGDAGKIRQILFNFIDNALKFTPHNGKISIRCEIRPSSVPVSIPDELSEHDICSSTPLDQRRVKIYMAVTDTGIGISEEAQQRLFKEEFIQADETIAAKFSGCGLGLSICKKMIDSLEGEIGIESKPSKGSTFWVTVDGLEKVEPFSSIDWYYGHKEHIKLPPQRILLVEDNILNQKSMNEILQYLDHTVTSVSDGMEALRELYNKDFDLVITDLQMPRVDGLHLIRSIRALSSKKDIPILALTARTTEEDKKACTEAGATRHIPKPITMWALQKIIAEVLGYHQETDHMRKEAKRNTYYQEQDQPDNLQLIAVDQSVLKALSTILSNEDVLEIITSYRQMVEEAFNQTLHKIIRQEDFDKAIDIVRDFRCMSGTLGLSRVVDRLEKLQIALQNKDQHRIYDYYYQANEEICTVLTILKDSFKNKGQASPNKPVKKEENGLLISSTIDKKLFCGLKTFYVFSKDQALRNELQDQLGYYGYDVKACTTFKKLRSILPKKNPFLLMIDLDQVKNSDEVVQFCQEQQGVDKNCCYMMISSSEDDLKTRRKAVQLGARDFYAKPLDYNTLIDKLDSLALAGTSEPYRVLIIDDEPRIAKYHSIVLGKAGMITEILTDPLACIETLYKFQPDIVLMDIYMSACNGIELSHIIRQHQAFVGIPITFLSGERRYAKHLAALQGGGDEFLSKPIDPARLIESVTLRMERLRKLRSFMIRDSLTGLFNHNIIKENLINQVAQTEREKITLSFALIDIDRFKSVNDTYGHPVGDRIIKALSRYLKQHLRRTDIIGRYGGEEFAIILPNTQGKEAKEVIDKIREGFASLHHKVDKQKTIQVTFSAGIATYPEVKEWSDIIKIADEKLYAAKKQSRNCTVEHKS